MTEENNKNASEIPAETETPKEQAPQSTPAVSSTKKPPQSTQTKSATAKKTPAANAVSSDKATLEALIKEKAALLKKIEVLEASKTKNQALIAELEQRIRVIQSEKDALITQNDSTVKESDKTIKELEKQLEKFLKSQSKKEKTKDKKEKKDKKKEPKVKSKAKKVKKGEAVQV